MLRDYWSFSWPLLITAASTLVIAQGALIAGEAAVGLAGVGAMTLAVTISVFADKVDGIVTGTMYPAICAVRDRADLLLESFVKSNRIALMWAFPFGVALTLFSGDLVSLVLGEKWRTAVPLLQAYGLTAAVGHIGFNWHAYFRARAETRPIAVVQVIAMATFVVVALPLLFLEGLPGFAVGVGAMTVTVVVARGFYLTRLFPGFVMARHAARSIAPTIPAALIVLAVRLLESGERGAAAPVAELAAYAAVTVVTTLALERPLLREVAGYVRNPRAAAA